MIKPMLCGILALSLQGCGADPVRPNEARITIATAPEGATLSFAGKVVYAPYTMSFHDFGRVGQSAPITVTWPSGATRSITLKLIPGTENSVVIPRPVGAPGLAGDMALAAQSRERQARDMDAAMQSWDDAAKSMGKALGGKLSK